MAKITPYELELSNPIASALVANFVSDGTNVVNTVTGVIATEIGTGIVHGEDAGGLYFTLADDNWLEFPVDAAMPDGMGFTVMCHSSGLASANMRPIVGTTGSAPRWILYERQYSIDFVSAYIAGGYVTSTFASSYSDVISARFEVGNTVSFFAEQSSDLNNASSQVSAAAALPLIIGVYNQSNSFDTYGKFYAINIANEELTDTQILSLHAEPSQIYKDEVTATVDLTDYGLTFINSGQSVSLPLVGAYSGTITYTDNTTLAISGTGTHTIDGTVPISIKYIETVDTTGSQYYDFNRTQGVAVPELLNGQDGTLVGFDAGSGYVRAVNSTDGISFSSGKYVGNLPTFSRNSTWFWASVYIPASASGWLTVVGAYSNTANVEISLRVNCATGQLVCRMKNYGGDASSTFPDTSVYEVGSTANCTLGDYTTIGFRPYTTTESGCTFKVGENAQEAILIQDVYGGSDYHWYGDVGGPNAYGWDMIAKWQIGEGSKYGNSINSTTSAGARIAWVKQNATNQWDLTKAVGLKVPDIVAGGSLNLVGFTNVFYRPEANNEIIGYDFSSLSVYATASGMGFGANFKITARVTTGSDVASSQWMFHQWDGASDNRSFLLRVNAGQFQTHISFDGINGVTGPVTGTILPYTRYTVVMEKAGAVLSVTLDDGVPATLAVDAGSVYAASVDTLFGAGTVTLSSVFSGILEQILVDKSGVAAHNYDLTIEDADSFIDLVGGNHATPIGIKTSGWMPIVDTQTFLIAPASSDYTSPQGMLNVEVGKPYFVNGFIADGVYSETLTVAADAFPNNFKLSAINSGEVEIQGTASHSLLTGFIEGIVFSSDPSNIDHVVRIAPDATLLWPMIATDCKMTNINNVDGQQLPLFISSGTSSNNDFIFRNCSFLSESSNSGVCVNNSSTIGNKLILDNCLVVHNDALTTNIKGAVRAFSGDIDMTNCVVYAAAPTQPCIVAVTGVITQNRVVTNDATGDIPNVDFTGAFVNG